MYTGTRPSAGLQHSILDDSSGIAGHYLPRGDVLCNDGSGTNDRTLSDTYSWTNEGARADPYVVLHVYRESL